MLKTFYFFHTKMVVREKDYIQQLANYVKKNLVKGYSLDSLRWALVRQGRNRTEVEKAIMLAQEQMAAAAPRFQPSRVIIEKKEEKAEKKKGLFARFVDWFKG